MTDRRPSDPLKIAFAIFALSSLANGAWMLFDPAGWYRDLPAAVPDTGPLNAHFVRDIGSAFVAMGTALLIAAFRPALRLPLVFVASLFYWLHALVHVSDTLAGRLSSDHWAIDFPGVYLPAILLAAVVLWLARRRREAA
jgi:hypothetical protein